MPDDDGKLTREEFDAAVERLNAEIKGAGGCRVCKKGKLQLNSMVGHLTNLPRTRSYPVLVVICDQCGYVRLHGAMKAGVVRPDKQENAENQDG